ncbi:mucin-7-like isoform X2 [Caloenas nicobarica]|uniref:mucin-7-like isoform X2 n=1 Tax=Caloenas nicobarica TaxID=187106 RepID=UPI0032B70816
MQSSSRTVKATTSVPSARTGCAPTMTDMGPIMWHPPGSGRTGAPGVLSARPVLTGCTSPTSTATRRAAPCVPWPRRGPWLTWPPSAPPAATSAPSARRPPTLTCASPDTPRINADGCSILKLVGGKGELLH